MGLAIYSRECIKDYRFLDNVIQKYKDIVIPATMSLCKGALSLQAVRFQVRPLDSTNAVQLSHMN